MVPGRKDLTPYKVITMVGRRMSGTTLNWRCVSFVVTALIRLSETVT